MKRLSTLKLAFATLAFLLLLAAPPAVRAHAIVIGTDPPDGTVLAQTPAQARVWFSEPILLNFTTVELVDSNGRTIEVSAVRLDAARPSALIVDLPPLAPGAYRFTWRTLSRDDIHLSVGSLVFGVQQTPDLPASTTSAAPAPAPLEVTLRWLNFTAAAILIGGLIVALAVLPGDQAASRSLVDIRQRLLWCVLWSTVAAMLINMSLLVAQAAQASGAATSSALLESLKQILTATDYGVRWQRREGLLVGLVLAVVLIMRRQWRQTKLFELAAVTPLILASVFLQAVNSHAAGLEDASLLKIGVAALHVLAVSAWIGGVIALTLAVAPLLRRGEAEAALAWTTIRRFGWLAAVSVALTIATGLYNSGQQVASIDALLVTFYGQSLLLKIGLVLWIGLLGLFNSALLHPRVADAVRRVLRQPVGWTLFAPRQLRYTVLIESIGGGIVLLWAALLSATSPARGPEFEPPAQEESTTPSSFTTASADLLVTFSIKPNRPGENFIVLGVFNTRRPAPAPIESVDVRLAPPDGKAAKTLTAEPLGDGKYQIASDALNISGEWQVEVYVRRSGLPDAAASTPWTVLPLQRNTPRRPVWISNQPLAAILTPLATVFAVISGSALTWLALKSTLASASSDPTAGSPAQLAHRD